MSTDRASGQPAAVTRGVPGSEAIQFVNSAQQLPAAETPLFSTPSDDVLAAIIAADKLATGALDLIRLFKREPEPGLVDSARSRLRLAIEQLDHAAAGSVRSSEP